MNPVLRWSIAALAFLLLFVAAAGVPAAPPAGQQTDSTASPPSGKRPDADGRPAPEGAPKDEAAAAQASGSGLTGKVLLPSAGEWVWWVEDARGIVAAGPLLAKGARLEWAAKDLEKAEGTLYVLNRRTGNSAAILLEEAARGEVELVDADFSTVHRLKVKVTGRSGDPVAAAFVRVKDSTGKEQTCLLAESDGGEAVFHSVAQGKAVIEVRYGDVRVTQEIRLERERKEPEAKAEVVLAGDVPTAAAAAAPGAPEDAREQPRPAPATPRALQAAVALILLAAAVAIVTIVLRNRRMTLRSALEKAGIPIEEDVPGAGGAAPAAVPPLDPDLVGPAPGAPGAPPAAPAEPAAAPSGPKLVGMAGKYAGAVFPVKADPSVIGREMTCDIALTDDATASRRHATISRSADGFIIRDEGSSNGTLVNGLRITEQPLKDGDEVQIGSTRFRFEA